MAQWTAREKQKTSYKKELEHAASPLLGTAWLGLVQDRMESWKDNHSPRKLHKQPLLPEVTRNASKTTPPTSGVPLTRVQLLGASPQGVRLEEVVQVEVHRTREPVDIRCLGQCAHLKKATLESCGVEALMGSSLLPCPLLTELNVPVCYT